MSVNSEVLSSLIEKSIADLNVDPALCRGEKNGQWNLKYKTATLWIDLFNFEHKPELFYLQIMSPVMKILEDHKEEFYNELLEMNFNTYGCSLCKKDEWIYVLSLRTAEFVTGREIDYYLDLVAHYSAAYKVKLENQFLKQ
jgi:hypothetical protein